MRIKYDDVAYILEYKKYHWFQKWFCTCEVIPFAPVGGYKITVDIKLPIYILLVMPYFILQVFHNIWYNGLRYGGYILDRRVREYYATKYDFASDRVKERFPQIDTEEQP